MKKSKTIAFILFIFCAGLSSYAQEYNTNKKEREEVFTADERDNIQVWFQEQTNSLGLSEEKRSEYSNVLVQNLNALYHLTDKENDYTKEELEMKFDSHIEKINKEVKPLLNKEQYKAHQKSIKSVQKAFHNRLDGKTIKIKDLEERE